MKYPLLVWMDLETTGLTDDSEIVEVAEHTRLIEHRVERCSPTREVVR